MVFIEGYDSYFTLKIYYGGIFKKSPRRKYIDDTISYVDDVDIDLFSVHELVDMYKGEQALYYHLCIRGFPLDYDLLPLSNDQDILKLSPSNVMIEELEPESVSPELNKKTCRREVIDVDESHNHSKIIVPYVMSQVSQQSNVINVNEGVTMGHIEKVCKGNLDNHVFEPQEPYEIYHVDCNFQNVDELICENVGGDQSVRLDEFEAFIEDYSYYVLFDVEYNVPNVEYTQVGMEILEDLFIDDSGDAFNSQSGDGSDYSGYDSDDSDYNVHESNLQFDVDVDMSDFHSVADVDKHKTKTGGNEIVHEELEVIHSDDYQFVGFREYERKIMLKEMSRSTICSHGEIHLNFIGWVRVSKQRKKLWITCIHML
uniref:PB1-like domain-containing protein n=1 Tax=Lactuca sativa TaxID=4236 RepID=A0A9R1UM24_LACSA|nr:hypothetical protein LSAT_V11C800439430 [Lactuca sativa]